MSLIFWDTVRGRDLADSLISNLSKIAKKPKQFCIWSESKAEALEIVEESINRLGKSKFC